MIRKLSSYIGEFKKNSIITPIFMVLESTSPSKKPPLTGGFFTWRKRWDSNPRARKGYLISSLLSFDHFSVILSQYL